ncbi:MAG: hypothetical protein JO082_14045 [Mycobacterium sp.]|nr:hypothetical protein [Mycobacterium sp.]MBV9723023.1 hypothetical protein [Mycobacterium sp.]
MASDDVPAEGGPGDTLNPSESTDSDEVRNDDGDIVVDPPDDWSAADKFGMTAREEHEGESLDDRLAAEEPDVLAEPAPLQELPGRAHRGQVSGTPEDGDSLFDVVEE